jgi:hypothetical protein
MKIWRLAFIAAVVGFIYGVTSSEPPFSHLQEAALSITRFPISWWADHTASRSNSALTRHTSDVVPHLESRDATFTAPVAPKCSETIQFRVLEGAVNKPTDKESDSESQTGIPGVRIGEDSFSIDAVNLSFSSLLKELSDKCDIQIVGRDTLVGKVISAKFDSMKLEDGIRQLMRVAGIENYALSYRIESEGQCAVSQIILLPRDSAVSENRHFARPQQQAGSEMTDDPQAALIREPAAEVPGEILADVQAEIQEEVPAEMQADILAEMLAELRNQVLGQKD